MVGLGAADADFGSEPAGPDVVTAADGVRRTSAARRGSSRRSIRCWSMMVTLAGVCAALSGAREAVMTIWLLSMGSAGMSVLLLTNMSSQGGKSAHAPRLVPAEETDDGPRQVPDFPTDWSGVTVAGTAPEFRRLPFEPPPADARSVGGTLVGDPASRAVKSRSSRLLGCA